MELRLTQRLPAPTHSKVQTEAASVNTTVKRFICMADGLYLFFLGGKHALSHLLNSAFLMFFNACEWLWRRMGKFSYPFFNKSSCSDFGLRHLPTTKHTDSIQLESTSIVQIPNQLLANDSFRLSTEQHMRLMDLPGLLYYPAHETCGFVLSNGCCTYTRCFREKCAPLKKNWLQ